MLDKLLDTLLRIVVVTFLCLVIGGTMTWAWVV